MTPNTAEILKRTEVERDMGKTVVKLGAMIRSESSKMNVLNQWDLVVQRVMAQSSGMS
jgi:hypothetical protein